jgi:hypothetical protein
MWYAVVMEKAIENYSAYDLIFQVALRRVGTYSQNPKSEITHPTGCDDLGLR